MIDFLKILETMIRIRLVEQYIAKRYPEQQMKCPTHLCIGQEAVPAVFGALTLPEDFFMGTYRSHGHYLAKGGDLKALFAELLGKPDGCSKGFGGSMHLIDTERNFMGTSAIVASGIPIAAGAALSLKYQGRPGIVVAFFGDAALEEGITYETANFALLHKLPLLMVCENNRLAIATPIEQRQSSLSLHDRFESMGFRGRKVAENDLQELLQIAQEEMENVRKNHQPSLIECPVSRFSVHVGHDIKGPVDAWWQDPFSSEANSCPLASCVRMLIEKRELTMEQVLELRQKSQTEIETAFTEAIALPSFKEIDTEQYVYASTLISKLPAAPGALKDTVHEFVAKTQSKLVNPF